MQYARFGTPFDKGGGHSGVPTIPMDSRYNNNTSLDRDEGQSSVLS